MTSNLLGRTVEVGGRVGEIAAVEAEGNTPDVEVLIVFPDGSHGWSQIDKDLKFRGPPPLLAQPFANFDLWTD